MSTETFIPLGTDILPIKVRSLSKNSNAYCVPFDEVKGKKKTPTDVKLAIVPVLQELELEDEGCGDSFFLQLLPSVNNKNVDTNSVSVKNIFFMFKVVFKILFSRF